MISRSREKVLDLRSVFGIEARVTAPAEATDGEYVELDCTLEPGGKTTIHYHPEQDETYRVLDGTLEVLQDGKWRKVPAGESLSVPRGAVHGFRNAGEAPIPLLNVHRPALAFQQHLETLERMIRAGKIRGLKDLRSLIHMSLASVEQEPSITIRPPYWLLRTLAFAGRRVGYTLD